MCELKDYEEETLELLSRMTIKAASVRLEVKPETIHQRLYRLRKKIEKAQNFINRINAYKKRSPRIRKLLTVVPKEEPEEEEVAVFPGILHEGDEID